jgi:hypothetical protein
LKPKVVGSGRHERHCSATGPGTRGTLSDIMSMTELAK